MRTYSDGAHVYAAAAMAPCSAVVRQVLPRMRCGAVGVSGNSGGILANQGGTAMDQVGL
jgi:hypothetical protein